MAESTKAVHFVILVLLQAAVVLPLPEAHCSHNVASEDLVHHVYLEPEHYVREKPCDHPFRIFVHHDPSVEQQLHSSMKARLKERIIPKLTSFFKDTLKVRATGTPIALYRDCSGGSFYPSTNAVKQCAFQCSSTTMCGTVEVPEQHLKACTNCDGSSLNCHLVGNDGPGVANSDYIMYVSAKSVQSCGGGAQGDTTTTVAFAGACQMEHTLNRPVAGYINFCPQAIGDDSISDEFILAVAQHEMLHALAFSWSLFPYWRDENGDPRTPRDEFGNPKLKDSKGQYLPGETTVKRVTYHDWQTRSGPQLHTVYQMVTPKVVAEARHHFNCPTLEGLELENQGGEGTALSHWEKRILADEVMSGVVPAHPVLSRMTLALMEDSGWYTVDYSKAEQLVWGKNAGCELPTGSCGGYINTRLQQGKEVLPYCTHLKGKKPQINTCSVDRKSVAECNLGLFTSSLPVEYQYFNEGDNFQIHNVKVSAIGGDVQIADFCPFQRGFSNKDCTQTRTIPSGVGNLYAEAFGEQSRCIEHGSPWNATEGLQVTYSEAYGSGCYKVLCSEGRVNIYVFEEEFSCSSSGQEIEIDIKYGNVHYQGSLICPSCDEMCYENSDICSNSASGHDSHMRNNFKKSTTDASACNLVGKC